MRIESEPRAALLEERRDAFGHLADERRQRGGADLEHLAALRHLCRREQPLDEAVELAAGAHRFLDEAPLLGRERADLLAQQDPAVAADHRHGRAQLVAHHREDLVALRVLVVQPVAQRGEVAVQPRQLLRDAQHLLAELAHARRVLDHPDVRARAERRPGEMPGDPAHAARPLAQAALERARPKRLRQPVAEVGHELPERDAREVGGPRPRRHRGERVVAPRDAAVAHAGHPLGEGARDAPDGVLAALRILVAGDALAHVLFSRRAAHRSCTFPAGLHGPMSALLIAPSERELYPG